MRWPRILKRDVEPLEGTNISLFNTIIPAWWAQEGLSLSQQWVPGDGRLAERVWTSSRCIQLNAQQIASMPVRFEGPESATPPAWLSSPDPLWYPNGIGDAMFSIVAQLYAWGFACLYVTDFYADGFPRRWTVLDSSRLTIRRAADGGRSYKIGSTDIDPGRVVQIDRNPGSAAHGCSALEAFSQNAWGLLAAGNQSMAVSQGAMPKVYLQSKRKLQKAQAEDIQTQWMQATSSRNGAPPVVPPELEPQELAFNPSDMALLETQEWNAKVLANAYGVPAVLLNMALQGGLTYQNPAALGEMWWRFELRPTGKRIVDAFTAQMLPAGSYVWLDAGDTFLPLDPNSETDDPQESTVAKASPAQQPRLTAVGGTTP
jgi:HK97 family phage portal protein